MKAADVKAALRARHPALDQFGGPGPWTCIEEWMNIDLLAVSAWASVKPYPRYARVGYEVKVSRSDYKRELAKPFKRAGAVAFCHEFYFAVPHGLLKPHEIQWEPPAGFNDGRSPFVRPRCPGAYGYSCEDGRVRRRALYNRGRGFDRVGYRRDLRIDAVCPTCWGAGWIVDSAAVRAGAPALWIPADVGLIVSYPSGRLVIAKKAPRHDPPGGGHRGDLALAQIVTRSGQGIHLSDHQLAELVRWVSFRPDPRHTAQRARRNPESPVLSPE